MKQKIRIILIFVLLLLLIVVIVIVIVIIVNKTRGCCTNNLILNQLYFFLIIIFAALTAAVMLAVVWMKLSTMMQRRLVNSSNIVQKYYQKYRKQFLRLCCCSYHVPPGPGPGGGGGFGSCCGGSYSSDSSCYSNRRNKEHFNTNKNISSRNIRKSNITSGENDVLIETNIRNSSMNVFPVRSIIGNNREDAGNNGINNTNNKNTNNKNSNIYKNNNNYTNNSNKNSYNNSNNENNNESSNEYNRKNNNNNYNINSSDNNNNNNNDNNNDNNNSNSINSNNCCKASRRRRSLSGGLVWLLIGLVWLEGPLLISCKMNSSGDHMIKINSNTNRIMSTEQQNKKFDILSNNKRFNKIYNKNSSNSNKISGNSNNNSNNSNNNSNNSNNNSNSGATSGSSNNSASNGKNSNKNNYNNKDNNNSTNTKGNENNNTKSNNNTKNNKYKNNSNQNSNKENNKSGSTSRSNRNINNNKQLYNTNSNSYNHNNNNNNDDKFTDNNYYRYSNNYNYLDHYQIQDQENQQHQIGDHYYSEHQERHQAYHYHTPVHLSAGTYQTKQLLQEQQQQQQQQQQYQRKQHQHEQHQHKKIDTQHQKQHQQSYDSVYIDDTDKRSILASIGCPNCVFNDNYNYYNNKPFISSDTSSLGTLLSSSVAYDQYASVTSESNLQESDNNKSWQQQQQQQQQQEAKEEQQQQKQSLQYQNINNNRPKVINHLSSDMIRLESIKRQILSKLGMKSKPNVTHPLPKQFIMDTLYRADGGDYVGVNFGFHSTTTSDMNSDDSDYSVNDDYGSGNSHNSDNNHDNTDDLPNIVMYNNPNLNSDLVFDVISTHTNGASVATESDLLSSHSYQYQKNQEESFVDTDDFFGSTKEIITFAEKGKMFNGHRLIEFPSPADQVTGQDLQIRSATIWIRIESRQQHNLRRRMQTNETNLTIWIFQLSRDDIGSKDFDELATLSSSLSVRPNQLGWQKLDITETVRQWHGRGKSGKLRLLIDCTGCGHRFNLHLFQPDSHNKQNIESDDDNQRSFNNQRHSRQKSQNHHNHHHQHNSYNRRLHRKRQRSRKDRYQTELQNNNNNHGAAATPHQHSSSRPTKGQKFNKNRDKQNNSKETTNVDPNRPFLVIYTDPNRVRRVRRRAVDCSGAINGQCCKESFYVSFKALGWDDWIIAPHGYFANYCRGDCGGPHRTPDTFQSYHTHVMEEFRKMDRLNGMQPCCAPLKFSSMSLIYYGNEGIIKRDLPKMVVDECGCP